MTNTAVNSSLDRVDALGKVTGQAIYAADIHLAGMLHGKVLTSPHPHARIHHIDTSRAQRLRGVKGIITGHDTRGVRLGPLLKDQPVMAVEKVRFLGEFVAAVAATDPDIAEEALELLRVEYEELPPVFDPMEAMSPDAPRVHEDLLSYTISFQTPRYGNVCTQVKVQHGDVREGFAASQIVLEKSFRTQSVHQGYLEPHASLAAVDATGRITVWSTAKGPYRTRSELAEALGLPMSRIRVVSPYLGGDFGGKGPLILEPLAALLAQKSGRPVKLELSRRQEFSCVHPRHPCLLQIKLGARRDGTLLALEGRVIFDAGAYADTGPLVVGKSADLQGVYRIPHVRIDGYCVYTNKSSFGNCRAPGSPQAFFAIESTLDLLARELGLDPLELRLKNAFEEGDLSPVGQRLHNVAVKETLRRAAEATGWLERTRTPGRGWGLACGAWHCAYGPSSATIKINEDGTAVLLTGAVEQGSGTHTVLTQVAAEVLGLRPQDFTLIASDTDTTPYESATGASRQTYNAGLTVKMAAEDARRQLFERAADRLEASVEDLEAVGGQVRVKGSPEKAVSLRALTMAKGQGPIIGRASQDRPSPPHDPSYVQGMAVPAYPGHTCATHIAQVEVDRETGDVRVLKMVAAQDVGFAINPKAVEGQMEGGLAAGLGFALSEEIAFAGGRVTTDSLMDYRMPTALDLPQIASLIVEQPDEGGPFGAKSAGELPYVPVAAAIANAIYDAIGVRITELPITPQKVREALARGNMAPPDPTSIDPTPE
jgi:CO/xanthine dehydrogenase Mo-binding subunit